MRCAALLFLALSACSKATLPADSFFENDQPCALAANSPELVLGFDRSTNGDMEPGVEHEAGEVTVAAAACTTKTQCAVVTNETMDHLTTLVRQLGRIRHHKETVSPHYGGRFITARWPGGQCSLADDVLTPIDERDKAKFYVAYDAIHDAVVARRAE